MTIPSDYVGREQSWLKHKVLEHYLSRWGQKLLSTGRYKPVRAWFVDCFAGPWDSSSDGLADTSVEIGLGALRKSMETWRQREANVEIGAVFVEANPTSFKRLQRHLRQYEGEFACHAFEGRFEDHVDRIDSLVAGDPAFMFVDPTGFKGAAMRCIRPLAGPKRDVLINVMFHHAQRWKTNGPDFMRKQIEEFFGVDEPLDPSLDEAGCMDLYRSKLKEVGLQKYAADLVIPHRTKAMTHFRLVVGGHHPEILKVFREAEKKVIGDLAPAVLADARAAEKRKTTGQFSLFGGAVAPIKSPYEALRAESLETLERLLTEVLDRPRKFEYLWPPLLEACHLPLVDVRAHIWQMGKDSRIVIQGIRQGERSLKPHHILSLPL